MHRALLVVGILALLIGLLWIGQGTGVFRYPKESFMIDERPWAWIGAIVAAIGVVLVIVSRGRRPR